MIRLAARIAFAGGGQALVRLTATAIGLALGSALLLFAGVAFPALHAHDLRAGWRTTSANNREPAQNEADTDPLLWRLTTDHFQGRPLIRTDVAAQGARSPVPPGLTRLPGPGQIAVSPALQRLLATVPSDQLGNRFPGRISEVVGPEALVDGQDLVVFVGHAPDELQGEDGVVAVRSIESAPVRHGLTDFLRVVVVIGVVGLLVPVLVFVSAATRLAAARRDQRLAALRLIGASPAQTATIAAVEAAAAAVAGTSAGFIVFLALRPAAANIPFDGATFYPTDLRLPPAWTALIAVGVPALSILTAIVTLSRVRLTPLGVARATRPPQPSATGLIPLASGLVLLGSALTATAATHSQPLLAVAGLAFAVIIVGIVRAGPWLTARIAGAMARVARRAPLLIAARRLQDNPSAGFRNISGLVLATFVASVFSGLTPALTAHAAGTGPDPAGNQLFATLTATGPLPPGPGAALLHTLRTTPGVIQVVDLRQPPPGAIQLHKGLSHAAPTLALIRCTQLAATRQEPGSGCRRASATTAVYLDPVATGQLTIAGLQPSAPIANTAMKALPLQAIITGTDGAPATIERVRTSIEAAAPGATPASTTDLGTAKRSLLTQLERLSNVALLLTLLVAGCSLAIAMAAGLIERKRPFSLLRLAGTPTASLATVVLAEAAVPLILATILSAVLGLTVADVILRTTGGATWHNPAATYWYALAAGVPLALLVVASTLPLLNRITSLETARYD